MQGENLGGQRYYRAADFMGREGECPQSFQSQFLQMQPYNSHPSED